MRVASKAAKVWISGALVLDWSRQWLKIPREPHASDAPTAGPLPKGPTAARAARPRPMKRFWRLVSVGWGGERNNPFHY